MALDDLVPPFNFPVLIFLSMKTGKTSKDVGGSKFGHLLRDLGEAAAEKSWNAESPV
jgi:hypothetical protein